MTTPSNPQHDPTTVKSARHIERLFVKVISMPSAADRRRSISHQLNATELDWTFFDAHTSITAELTVKAEKFVRINGRTLDPGELYCYSSHWSLLQAHAFGSPGDVMIVFEDDAIIDPFFFSDQADLIRLGNKYDFLRLSGQLTAPSEEVEILGRRRIVRFKKRIYGTLAYLVSIDAAKTLTPMLSCIHRPIDVEYDRFWAHGIDIFCVYPFPVLESYKTSQLGSRGFRDLSRREFFMWKSLNAIERARRLKANLWRCPRR